MVFLLSHLLCLPWFLVLQRHDFLFDVPPLSKETHQNTKRKNVRLGRMAYQSFLLRPAELLEHPIPLPILQRLLLNHVPKLLEFLPTQYSVAYTSHNGSSYKISFCIFRVLCELLHVFYAHLKHRALQRTYSWMDLFLKIFQCIGSNAQCCNDCILLGCHFDI